MKNHLSRNKVAQRRHAHFRQKRHQKMTDTISNFIYEATIRSKGLINSVEMHHQINYLFDISISPTRIRGQKKLLKLVWRRARKAPKLTQSQKKDRLDWCQANINNSFLNFIFVDETSIWINECPLYIWRPVDSYPEASGFSSKLRQKLNLWGGISCKGPTNFVTFTNNMDQYNYLEILAKVFIPFAQSRYGNNYVLHQDNDPKHTSFTCKHFLQINNVIWGKAPAQSPDLNPIEMVWADMKNYIASKLCKNLDDIKVAIGEYRITLSPEKCSRFIGHLKKVMEQVIYKNGGWSNM